MPTAISLLPKAWTRMWQIAFTESGCHPSHGSRFSMGRLTGEGGSSVFINDAEDGLLQDYDDWLEQLAPHAPTSKYRQNRTGEDNADAHLKRQIMGRELVVAITNGKLDFGPWEQIFYGEFDGRRRKRVLVKIIGEQTRRFETIAGDVQR